MSLTPKIVAFIASVEGIALETYLDPKQVPTWSLGVTAASGVDVKQYIGHPAPMAECLKAALNSINHIYLPRVLNAFAGHPLTESQLAAALSFEWNTGAIGTANWVKLFLGANIGEASFSLVDQWSDHGLLHNRRVIERQLFFGNTWPPLDALVYSVLHPSMHLGPAKRVDILPVLQQIMGGA